MPSDEDSFQQSLTFNDQSTQAAILENPSSSDDEPFPIINSPLMAETPVLKTESEKFSEKVNFRNKIKLDL